MEIEEDTAVIPSEETQSHSGSWISPIMRYLQHGEIPMGENPRAFRIKVSQFTILNNVLYKRSLAGPYLRCIEDPEIQEVLRDFHEGDCGNHTGGRALFSRILRTGYYWPTMKRDAVEYAKKCDPCQRHGNILHQPAEFLHPIPSSWPFMRWGMDIVGKLPKAPGGKVFMLAMTDYFSKWIEAEAFAQVREKEVISFIKRNIITRFGIPSEIVCDNGSQFIGSRTTNFCDSWGIKMITSTPVHPQANGQAESSNKIIINNLKKKLGSKKGKFAEELPYVLWADRTTPKNATGQTPFSLVFGAEAVIPTEMVVPTARTSTRDPEENAANLAQDLDTIEEIRDLARIRMASYQQRMAGAYNKNVRIRKFQVGDMVLRKAFQNTINPADGKLAPKWEGPYLIEAEAGKGAYRLLTMEGNLLPRAWNAVHFKEIFHVNRILLAHMIPTLKASSKDPDNVNDPYSGKILILNNFIFLFYLRIRIMHPSSSSHENLSSDSPGILSISLRIFKSISDPWVQPQLSLGLSPVSPVAHDDPGIVHVFGTSTHFRG
ncbi:putative integrase, catalytic core, ribonuclease H-like superfamily, integrase zinc-binding protein [Helianthus annuus]|nr:putative integrase, catalytic core, ribonuclease H-like superfamily, integrase zinc-binding protein [Helianthus annuus]